MRIELGYPDRKAEKKILKGEGAGQAMEAVGCCMSQSDVIRVQQQIDQVYASDIFLEYLQDLLEFTRKSPEFQIGLSPRAGLSLSRAAKAWAFLHGRDHTLPEDLQHILPWVAGHRLRSAQDLTEISRDNTSNRKKACHEIKPKTDIRFSHPAWIFVPGYPHRHDDRCRQLQQQCRIYPCLSVGGYGPDFRFSFF
jgi:MoxR-like ATPase